MLSELSKDELFLIAMKLDCRSLLKFSMCNKRIYDKIYANESVWNGKLKEFPDYLNPKYINKIYYSLSFPDRWDHRQSQPLIPDYKDRNKREIYILLYRLTILKENLQSRNNIYDIYNSESFEYKNVFLKEFPKHIEILTNLKKIDLSYNQITHIPKEIGILNGLQELYLLNNKINDVPKELEKLIKLKYTSKNLLEYIPEKIKSLNQDEVKNNFLSGGIIDANLFIKCIQEPDLNRTYE